MVGATKKALDGDPDYRLIICADEAEGRSRFEDVHAHLVVCDCDVLDSEDDNVLTSARIAHPHAARILIGSATQQGRLAVIAKRAAVYLYALKPVPVDLMRLMTKRSLELAELSRRHRLVSRELKLSMDDGIFEEPKSLSVKGGWSQFERLVYVSAKMDELCREAKQAARTELPVLIEGETGTGKELLARAIHYNSTRMNSPMHVQNCGGMPDEMLHSELFGHTRGAFTGAVASRLGLFRAADGGTVFLDEISDVSKSFQVSLLRFLQEGEVKPLGSDKIEHANVRIIAASNKPLRTLVDRGEFRRDLYYRLRGFELSIPSLRERPEDIPILAQFFIEKHAGVVGRRVVGLTRDAIAKLEAYHFPGNVRELESEVRRMVALAEQGGYISARHLSSVFDEVRPISSEVPSFAKPGQNLKSMVEALEKQVVQSTLQRHHWNQSKAAQELGLSRVGLANKIKRYELNGS
ncbi:MAG: sigma-54-dependent Fis family transcriptional regulator [Rhodospirillales bacterium]|nr:sigma-54-dependent Fis family transcriptional regulator [Rhodospirillales bacterium]